MDLLTIGKTYPLITFIVAILLFIIGFKIAKVALWVLAGIAVLVAVGLLVF